MSPSGDMRILSRPRGPRDVLTILATVRAARICDLTASLPCCLFFLPWLKKSSASDQHIRVLVPYSRTTINGLPCSSFTTEAIEIDQYRSATAVLSNWTYPVTYRYLQCLELVRANGVVQKNVLMAILRERRVFRLSG